MTKKDRVPSEGYEKKCPECGKKFKTQAIIQIYCKSACRQKADRKKNK